MNNLFSSTLFFKSQSLSSNTTAIRSKNKISAIFLLDLVTPRLLNEAHLVSFLAYFRHLPFFLPATLLEPRSPRARGRRRETTAHSRRPNQLCSILHGRNRGHFGV